MGSHIGIGKLGKQNNDNFSAVTRIAIFASGAGSNAEKIIEHFAKEQIKSPMTGSKLAEISLIVCNKPGAGVLKIAASHHIPTLLIEKEPFLNGNAYLNELKADGIDFIVLAGFLWKIPKALIAAYPNKIINIHPALLPKYGGKGMYGQRVHEAVIAHKEVESGISIHWVDDQYDHGSVIFQTRCPVMADDTAETLAARIHQLEHQHYPQVIENLVKDEKQ